MGTQLIFCLETKKSAATDWVYIKESMRRFYSVPDMDVKLSPVFMGTKSKYNAKETARDIKGLQKRYQGASYVFLCIDTDDYDSSYNDTMLNNSILEYCKEKDYQLIWFCRDIEEVFLGKRISDNEKVRQSGRFRNSDQIMSVDESRLRKNSLSKGKSNLLLVLDQYLSGN